MSVAQGHAVPGVPAELPLEPAAPSPPPLVTVPLVTVPPVTVPLVEVPPVGVPPVEVPGRSVPGRSVPTSEAAATSGQARRRALPGPRAVAERSPASAWARTLRLGSLPATLLGGVVAGLLVSHSASTRPDLLAIALVGLLCAHLLAALLRALGDPRPGRAHQLRRAEAGRAALVLAALAVALLGTLVAARGPAGLVVSAVGVLPVLLAVRHHGSSTVRALSGAAGGGAAVMWTGWAATGVLDPLLLAPAAAVGAVSAGLLVARRHHVAGAGARALALAPHVAAGVAVALGALPLACLAVVLALPAVRRSSSAAARGDAAPVVAGHARLFAVLLVVSLLAAATAPVSGAAGLAG